jgi:hypothetical protein
MLQYAYQFEMVGIDKSLQRSSRQEKIKKEKKKKKKNVGSFWGLWYHVEFHNKMAGEFLLLILVCTKEPNLRNKFLFFILMKNLINNQDNQIL